MNENFKIDIDVQTQKNIELWLQDEYDEQSKAEIQNLIKTDPKKLVASFYAPLTFSTGGLRGLMGVGPRCINKYTIGTYVQGIANCLKNYPPDENPLAVVIGYDCRHNSQFFAFEAAKIFAGNQIKVFLFSSIRPSPLISFGCRFKRCQAALMITASHNPAEYNGCKVYWNDGGQVLGVSEKNISHEVSKITQLNLIQQVKEIEHPYIIKVDKEIDDAYIEMTRHLQNYRDDNQTYGEELKIVYTSLHGTGINILPNLFEHWGFKNLHFVEEQIIASGNFPTVAVPNPEDPRALELGIKKLKEANGDILIATDPDGDRIGAAIRIGKEVKFINGNQMAVLLLSHICQALAAKNKLAANAAFIKTIVTSELFQDICDYYQKPCFNVLPGFKYVAEKIRQWEAEPKSHQFIFGAEDSCGYLYGTHVRDKDAILTSALIAEMALQAKIKGKTLFDNLCELYKIFGVYHEEVYSLLFDETKEGRLEMLEKMVVLRRMPPKEIANIQVVGIEDYERSLKINLRTRTTTPLSLPKANILLFWLADGSKLVIRPSGTEPKIKFYCSVTHKGEADLSKALNAAKKHALDLIQALIN